MAEYVLSCSSTADLSEEFFAKRNISYALFHFELDGKAYMDDLGKSVPFKDFYQAMRDGASTKTFQINMDEYMAYFETFLEQGKDIIHLTLSSGISGTYNSAKLAESELMERYPDRKIYIIDSLGASSGYGLLMDKLADLRDEGMSIDDLRDYAQEHALNVQSWFFTSDLTYLIRGGRVSKAAGFIGGVMNICPLLNINFEGKLISRQKIRTKKKVIQETVKKIELLGENGIDYSGKVFISNSDCEEDANEVIALIRKTYPKVGDIELFQIGTTIGSHTGPGTVAVFFWGDKRVD